VCGGAVRILQENLLDEDFVVLQVRASLSIVLHIWERPWSAALPAYLDVVYADLRNGLDLGWCDARWFQCRQRLQSRGQLI
jgi:hypothetical protein